MPMDRPLHDSKKIYDKEQCEDNVISVYQNHYTQPVKTEICFFCLSNPENIYNVYRISSVLVWPILIQAQTYSEHWWLMLKIQRKNAIKLPFLCIIFVAVYDKLHWSCPMMIGSHQSELQFPRIVITWNHLYQVWPSQILIENASNSTFFQWQCNIKMHFDFRPRLIWLSLTGLLLAITLYIHTS